ncbi:hypothetical protein SDC9_109605 [bioreactor metagenome]|uniref:Uncharacterized protein n=1 Tax=bioreactor metagenome TaxID=1076179 RepID=A0A645BCF7_9ZZZZ
MCAGVALAHGGCLHDGVEQRKFVDLAREVIHTAKQAGGVGHGHLVQAVQVVRQRALHRRKARLRGAFDALVGALERGDHRLQAAGELRLLQRQAQAGFDVHYQVLIARARQALHQFFELRALQCHLVHPCFGHGQAGRGVARQVGGLARHGAGFDGLRAGVCGLAGQLFLNVGELVPQHDTADEPGDGHHAHGGDQQTRACGRCRGSHRCGRRRECGCGRCSRCGSAGNRR